MTNLVNTLAAAAVAAGIGLSLSAASYAQSDAAHQPPADGHARHGWGEPGDMRARMQARMAERASLMHDALAIRSDQEAAWTAFLTQARRPAGERPAGPRAEHAARAELTTPERLDRMAKRMGERQAAFQRRADAVKTLYAALDSSQRKTFDALVNLRFTGFGGDGGRFRHMD